MVGNGDSTWRLKMYIKGGSGGKKGRVRALRKNKGGGNGPDKKAKGRKNWERTDGEKRIGRSRARGGESQDFFCYI